LVGFPRGAQGSLCCHWHDRIGEVELGKLGTDHSEVDQVTGVTAGSRMLDGDLDHLAAHLAARSAARE
jgi:hypothetical protein